MAAVIRNPTQGQSESGGDYTLHFGVSLPALLKVMGADHVVVQQIDSQHGMIKQIYGVIVDDNAKSGVTPSSLPSSTSPGSRRSPIISPRPLSMPLTPFSSNGSRPAELFLSSSQGSTPAQPKPQLAQNEDQFPQAPIIRKERPIVHTKPEGLQIHTKTRYESSRAVPGDVLEERFSRLRVLREPVQSKPEASSRYVNARNSAEVPSPTEYTPSSSDDSSSLANHSRSGSEINSSSVPRGPRSMPVIAKLPPPPPKVPLDTEGGVVLPRAPSPAYNPATFVSPTNTNAPIFHGQRANGNYLAGSPRASQRLPGTGSSARSGLPSAESDNRSNGTSEKPRISLEIPSTTYITAAQLYESLQTSNVLIMDVRSREDFDQGHVFSKSIMCIEPLSLKSGISAEEMEDRLIISPETEQTLFELRNEFDLVVFYDQNTQSDRFLRGPPTRTEADHLRALHDTIYEFNNYKPLQRPPLVLAGGLDSWVDLVGPQALATSKTAALVGSARLRQPLRRAGRPIGRVLAASANSSLEVRKRRLRDQKPLDAHEERTWLEKVRNEGVDPADYQNAQSDDDETLNSEEPPSPFVYTYEDFLRRYPEASPVQQSMMMPTPPPPSRAPPMQPPSRSTPSVPSRPPPAVPRPSYSGVSDRDSSHFSPTSRQPSATRHPLYTSRSISHYLKLPRTGLINFGVTCYMNATIQCLLATIPLSQIFLGDRWREFVQPNWKGSHGVMPEIYANLIRNLWKNDVHAIRPSSLRKFCARLNGEWGVDRQQDAKEFFDFLVDCLHEDLNDRWERSPLQPLTEREEMRRERMPIRNVSDIEWARYSHRESSFISNLFAGQHASRLRCTTCQGTSTTYEAFYSISVEIPRTASKHGWDIHDCLRSYCKEERLSGDEVWKCPYCKCEREATKKITITRAPQFLVVHFKRFEMRKGESAKKIHTPINFPLFGLDLERYMVPSNQTSRPRDPRQLEEPVVDTATTPPYMYDAYAVMRHIGASGNGGHYISLVRDAARGCWRKFDDERVADFEPGKLKHGQALQNEQAYLVFYGRSVAR